MEKNTIFTVITDHCREILDNHQFQEDDDMEYLGANSIDRAEIINMTMETMSLHIPRVDFYGAKTIGSLTDIFYAKITSN